MFLGVAMSYVNFLSTVKVYKFLRAARFASVLLLLPLMCNLVNAQQLKQQYRQYEIDQGAGLYAANCAECHVGGDGVPGVNLRTGQFKHSVTDEDLMAVIRNGIPGTAMPPHTLIGSELAALVAFIRSMQNGDAQPVKLGDEAKGKQLFQTNGCFNCHRVGAQGSRRAINLSDAGTMHPPSFLQKALLDPGGAALTEPEIRMMRATTNKGAVITGRRLNEDTFTIQLMDEHENLVTLEKPDLKSLVTVSEPPMASLKGKMSEDQIGDLVAYLASLRGTASNTGWQTGPGNYMANQAAAERAALQARAAAAAQQQHNSSAPATGGRP